MLFRKTTLLIACAGVLASCAKEPPAPVYVLPEPSPSPQQICQPAALAQERSSAIETVRGAETQGSQSSQTFLSSKLERYEARLEIAYRDMVATCQIYANCLDRNDGDEQRCVRSEENHASARRSFYAMISEADRLAAEVRTTQTSSSGTSQSTSGRRTENREGRCRPECATTANVFTDDCCPVENND